MTKKTARPAQDDESSDGADAFEQAIASAEPAAPAAAAKPIAKAPSPREQFFNDCARADSHPSRQAELIALARANPEWVSGVDADGFNALTRAAIARKADLAAALVELGSEVNAASSGMGWSALVAASARHEGDDSLARSLLEKGARADSKTHLGLYAIVAACTYGNASLAKLLVDAGSPASPVDAGCPTMVAAAGSGSLPLVDYLISQGVSPKATLGPRNDFSALHQAAKHGHAQVAARLLSLGAEPNLMSNEGNTPLHYAAAEGHGEVAKLLVKAGSDPHLENRMGKTPGDLARDPALAKSLAPKADRVKNPLAGKARGIHLNDVAEPKAKKAPKAPKPAAPKAPKAPAAKKTAPKATASKAPTAMTALAKAKAAPKAQAAAKASTKGAQATSAKKTTPPAKAVPKKPAAKVPAKKTAPKR